jgi:hypothetical protein
VQRLAGQVKTDLVLGDQPSRLGLFIACGHNIRLPGQPMCTHTHMHALILARSLAPVPPHSTPFLTLHPTSPFSHCTQPHN